MIKLYEGSDIYRIILTSGTELELNEDDLAELSKNLEVENEKLLEENENLLEENINLRNLLSDAETELEQIKYEISLKEDEN